MYSLKPVDEKAILDACSSKLLVSVEEHNINGGLGSIISEVLTQKGNTPRLLRLGIDDIFNLAGSYENLLSQNRLMPGQIAEDVKKSFEAR